MGFLTLSLISIYLVGYEDTNLELTDSEYDLNNEMNQFNQTGHTEPWAQVTINNEKVPVDKKGNFYKVVTINNGENIINITAKAPFKSPTSKIAIMKRTEENNHINLYHKINTTVPR